MTSRSGEGPAPGWYPDPDDRDQQRYWDGAAWTEHRHPASPALDETAVLPPVVSPPAREERTTTASRTGRGWVAALVGLIVGLVVGGTAAVVLVGNSGSSSSPSGSSSTTGAPTVTATSTATVTESVTTTATATATTTATVTVTASPAQ